ALQPVNLDSCSSSFLLPISGLRGCRQQPRRIEYEGKFRGDVGERRKQWIEQPESSQPYSYSIDEQCSGKVSHYDSMASPRDPQRLHKFQQIVTEQHNVGALSGDVGARSHGYANV